MKDRQYLYISLLANFKKPQPNDFAMRQRVDERKLEINSRGKKHVFKIKNSSGIILNTGSRCIHNFLIGTGFDGGDARPCEGKQTFQRRS